MSWHTDCHLIFYFWFFDQIFRNSLTVHFVVPLYTVIYDFGIINSFCYRSNLIQRRTHRNCSVTRNSSISSFQTNCSTKTGRLTNRSSCVCSQSRQCSVHRNCGSRTARGTTRNPCFVMRIFCHSICRVFC